MLKMFMVMMMMIGSLLWKCFKNQTVRTSPISLSAAKALNRCQLIVARCVEHAPNGNNASKSPPPPL